MRYVLFVSGLLLLSAAAEAQTVTVINGHPSLTIVKIEAHGDQGQLLSQDVQVEPGDTAILKIDTVSCEYSLHATFEDDVIIQARGVDVCSHPIWTVLDGDYLLD